MAATATYKAGSESDFAQLYLDTYPRLVRGIAVMVGDHAEAEDIVQDAYARAYKAWPGWHDDAPAEAWLWRIAVNVATSRLRYRRLRRASEIVRRLGRPRDVSADPAQDVANADLAAAMARLDRRQAAALTLRHVHGHSNVEIAQMLDCDVRTVTRLLTRAVAGLRRDLGDGWAMDAVPEAAE